MTLNTDRSDVGVFTLYSLIVRCVSKALRLA
jgi:hypothetical protein